MRQKWLSRQLQVVARMQRGINSQRRSRSGKNPLTQPAKIVDAVHNPPLYTHLTPSATC